MSDATITRRNYWDARGRWIVFGLAASSIACLPGMLFTPYPAVFNIPVTARFVIVTVAAHALFGLGLGLSVRRLAQRLVPPAGFAAAR